MSDLQPPLNLTYKQMSGSEDKISMYRTFIFFLSKLAYKSYFSCSFTYLHIAHNMIEGNISEKIEWI